MMSLLHKLFPPKQLPPVQLVPPSDEYQRDFIKACKESCRRGYEGLSLEELTLYKPSIQAEFVRRGSLGDYHPYLLVAGNVYLGFIEVLVGDRTGGNIFYAISPFLEGKGFGTEILRLILPKCRELGMNQLHLTVDRNNKCWEKSRRIIEKNGGVFDREEGTRLHFLLDLCEEA